MAFNSLYKFFIQFQPKLYFNYDVECIIDDWILLGFLVGNDFVPNLPNFHINHDAFPYLYDAYKRFLPTSDGDNISSILY